ncbi:MULTISPECIES: OB-fold domain-containing protein [unclassified Mycolicibacterium]|uniref:Zn-ribbon domain-containing OB-fold protein n=1 Tax=unclassified Mycolicibacterium TaxID=2636767 RepID=UPI001EE4A62F|nr:MULTISPECIES: OB-fold domain-containing protein [unclassified Mycolicibacterium]
MTEPSELTAPFWAAATEHRLVVPRSNTDGRYFFPPERCVPGTDSTDWQYVASSGHGKVYTFSVVYRAPSPDFEAPYVLAVVDLEEGWSMLTNVVDCHPEDVSVGMTVEVCFLDVENGVLPVFRPVA